MSDTVNPVWRQLSTPTEIADALIDLYRRRGEHRYDEAVTQAEHAAQCGGHAMASGASDELVVAAFLHDIGHLLLDEHERKPDFLDTDLRHEHVGARFLTNWFSEAVTTPVELHVPAKRYLCATEATYFDTLSQASVHSLQLQGGPMSDAEVDEFTELDYSDGAVDLRRWDELAKVAGAPAPGLDAYRDIIVDVLT